LEFPDEVDTPLDVPARERFQKYRGLKSWRTSQWDPYEELPVEYSRIWEFEAFGSTVRSVRQQYADDCYELADGCGSSALYCSVYLRNVPPSVLESQPRGVPFVLSGLFPCEQKVSVVHGSVSRLSDYEEVIKSKQEFSLHCGFRRFPARPIFSEIPKKSSSCKKFKYMRFLHEDTTACASFYAPVVFPPCRLLMFAKSDTGPELAAIGSIKRADPKQLIIKRAMLTGYPFKVHKSKAVVRFMFFQPPDVRWFKPVELTTKKGLRGHITMSLGTHGYMKARFSGHIKQDDTVCMNLYKRVYPKWHPPSWGGKAEDGPEEA
jgi:pre-rRNA-processing protein TSR1